MNPAETNELAEKTAAAIREADRIRRELHQTIGPLTRDLGERTKAAIAEAEVIEGQLRELAGRISAVAEMFVRMTDDGEVPDAR